MVWRGWALTRPHGDRQGPRKPRKGRPSRHEQGKTGQAHIHPVCHPACHSPPGFSPPRILSSLSHSLFLSLSSLLPSIFYLLSFGSFFLSFLSFLLSSSLRHSSSHPSSLSSLITKKNSPLIVSFFLFLLSSFQHFAFLPHFFAFLSLLCVFFLSLSRSSPPLCTFSTSFLSPRNHLFFFF